MNHVLPVPASIKSDGTLSINVQSLKSYVGDLGENLEVQAVDLRPKQYLKELSSKDVRFGASTIEVSFAEDVFRPGILLTSQPANAIVTNRRIHFDSLTNFRDFGGYPTPQAHMPWGRFYRSENLHRLSEKDWITLEDLKITKIVDLRTREEKDLQPTQLPSRSAIEIYEFETLGKINGHPDALLAVAKNQLGKISVDDMVNMYLDLLEHHVDDLASAVEVAESNTTGATLIHCTAGKDRTGLVAALIQLRAGVPLRSVYEDYHLSNLYRTPVRLAQLTPFFERHSISSTDVIPFLSAPLPALTSAISWIRLHRHNLISN